VLSILLMSLASLGGSFHVDSLGVHEVRDSAARLTYDAVEPKGKRKAPSVDHRSEDLILDGSKRAKVQANADDIARNFSVARWMIRKHLDFVTCFEFESLTGHDEFDDQVEQLVARWSRAGNCDRAGRHPLWRIVRLLEAQRTIKGDCGLLKLSDGRLQAIESDRVRNPGGATISGDKQNWVHGVKLDDAGRALAYAIHKRRRGSFEFERTVPAGSFILHGYFDRFDQVRGISPIVAALDPLRDLYENFTLALAKAKVEQLFALAFYRQANESAGDTTNGGDEGSEKGKYKVDFGAGPVLLDLDPGDRAEFLTSSSPHSNFQAFTELILAIAMKALDLPYIFADEGAGVFHSFRGSWLIYNRACESKREENRDVLNRLTLWRLMLALLDGELALPPGMTLGDVAWAWTHRGFPWFDPNKELNGDLAAIQGGFDTPQRITQKRGGGNWYANIEQTAKALKFAAERGVPVSFDPQSQVVEVVEREEGTRGK
jgi:capsid protein